MSNTENSKSTKTRIAVAGATGRVGSTLTELLAKDPVEVVALTRDVGKAKLPSNASAALVDFENKATLSDALRGVDRLFLSQGSSPQQPANEIALIEAAVAAGVSHIVKLSSFGPASRIKPLIWHMEIEAHLANQDVAYTILRPSAYNDLLIRAGAQIAAGSWGGAVGNGRTNFIDTRDVAEVARLALLETVPSGANRGFHLTGPRAWTMPEIAEEVGRLTGRPVTYTQRTFEEHRAALLASGLPPFYADLILGLDKAFSVSALGETTSTFQELTRHAPRSLTDWLTENIALFQKQP